MNNDYKEVSSCCEAKIEYGGGTLKDFIGEKEDKNRLCTMFCVCSKCKQTCNVLYLKNKNGEKNAK